jgi:hypothetical protein
MVRAVSILFCIASCAVAFAADSADSPGNPDASEGAIVVEPSVVDGEPPVHDPRGDRADRQQRFMSVGLLLLVLILIAGLVLVIAAMYLGGRMRKVARKPLPAARPLDELWYLKRQKEVSSPAGEQPTKVPPPRDGGGEAETRDA